MDIDQQALQQSTAKALSDLNRNGIAMMDQLGARALSWSFCGRGVTSKLIIRKTPCEWRQSPSSQQTFKSDNLTQTSGLDDNSDILVELGANHVKYYEQASDSTDSVVTSWPKQTLHRGILQRKHNEEALFQSKRRLFRPFGSAVATVAAADVGNGLHGNAPDHRPTSPTTLARDVSDPVLHQDSEKLFSGLHSDSSFSAIASKVGSQTGQASPRFQAEQHNEDAAAETTTVALDKFCQKDKPHGPRCLSPQIYPQPSQKNITLDGLATVTLEQLAFVISHDSLIKQLLRDTLATANNKGWVQGLSGMDISQASTKLQVKLLEENDGHSARLIARFKQGRGSSVQFRDAKEEANFSCVKVPFIVFLYRLEQHTPQPQIWLRTKNCSKIRQALRKEKYYTPQLRALTVELVWPKQQHTHAQGGSAVAAARARAAPKPTKQRTGLESSRPKLARTKSLVLSGAVSRTTSSRALMTQQAGAVEAMRA